MKTCCVVVIGHVDHGKTSLVRALSWIETDRLPEEKARGLSITPGFAHFTYPSGIIDFVDAPGHEDFIQAMISGATGARAALVVISSVEGIRAQTFEHLKIARLLGITNCIVAITKSDLLNPSEQILRLAEIRSALAQTLPESSPLVMCSAVTGEGIDALHQALAQLLPDVKDTTSPLSSFLPIDRVFTLPGHGTIVTGTLLGGGMHVGDSAVVQPAGHNITIRSLQSRGTDRDHVHAGERVAVNLRGAAVTDMTRGSVLSMEGNIAPSLCVDAALEMLPNTTQALTHMETVRVLFGTSNEVAQVRLFGTRQIAPACDGLVQLRFQKPIAGHAGQRAIIRRLTPAQTIGGAVFLDPLATVTGSGDKGRIQVLQAVKDQDAHTIANSLCQTQNGVAKLADLVRMSRQSSHNVRSGIDTQYEHFGTGLFASKQTIAACKAKILSALTAYHAKHPLRAMAPQSAIVDKGLRSDLAVCAQASLLAEYRIRQTGNTLAVFDHNPVTHMTTEQHQRQVEIENQFRAPLQDTPSPSTVVCDTHDQDLFNLLCDVNKLISLHNISLSQTLTFHTDTLADALKTLQSAFPAPQSFTTSQARAALATTRRIIVPILEHYDSCGVTLRDGNMRQMAPPECGVKASRPLIG